MATIIPSLIDDQLNRLKAELTPKQDTSTNIASLSEPPYVKASLAGNILRCLTGLLDVTSWHAATGGTSTSLSDAGSFTGVNSLVGCKVTFQGNVTAPLTNVVAYVISSDLNALNFAKGALPAAPGAGDNYLIEWTAIDQDLDTLEQGKKLGETPSNPYAGGPSLINALMKLIVQLGGALPSFLNPSDVNPFGIGSPNAGAGSIGHGGAILIATALGVARDTIAAYTKPA